MKRLLITLFFAMPSYAFAQFGLNVHQSNLPFIGLNYEIKNRIKPEIRIGTGNYFEATSLEGVVTYDLVNKEDYEVYAGAGIRVRWFEGVVIPVGITAYPFHVKQFGFHIELAPVIGENSILRGSWGIRYRFKRAASR